MDAATKSKSLPFVALACALAPLWACSRTKADGESADAGPPMFDADGWVRLDFPGCDFYAAPSADKMPPPLHWEPYALN